MKFLRHCLAGLLTTLALVCAPSAWASSSGVVISQVYGGGGNTFTRDYVELFNAGSVPVPINGWSVQYASAAGTGNFSAVAVSGTLQPGQYHLVGMATTAGGAALPTVDSSGNIAMSATAGKVALVNSATALACNGGPNACTPAQLAQIVDLVGYGTSATFFEGARAPAPSNTTAVLRALGGCTDSDNNAGDFSVGTPVPHNSASPLAPCSGANAPVVASCPASAAVGLGQAISLPLAASDADGIVNTASFVSGQVAGLTLANFTAAAAVGGAASVDLSVGAAVPVGSYPLVIGFGNGSQSGTCSVALSVAAPAASFTPIYGVQGSGSTSPFVTQTVTTRGVVTKVNNNGYFIQDAAGDNDPATSDGLFVFTGAAPTVEAGRLVEVTGQVSEFNVGAATNALTLAHTVTELVNAGTPLLLGNGSITPTVVNLPEAAPDLLERYEGMVVTINAPLAVSQNFFQGRFGQVTLSAGGRLIKPTQLHRPGTPAALALADQNLRASLLLDDGSSAQNPNPIPYIGADNTLRAGDTVTGLTGVIDYGLATSDNAGLADWRIHPTLSPVITRTNARSSQPAAAGGNLKLASFNVLNYFTTFTDGQTATGQTGQGCAPSGTTADCRGADNAAEFTRQRNKIIAALAALNADVVGLMEIQNNGDVAAQNLVDGLNASVGANTYAVVPAPTDTGTDAIRVAMIYKSARVAPVGVAVADSDAIHNRPPMAQTFRLVANNEKFSVVVNHFKSKSCTGATGADLDQGDGQGCFNARRTSQAQRLLTFIANVQSTAADTDLVALGDFNAYGQEDPVFTLVAGGLVDQSLRFDAAPYSFVFDGEAGTLDHGLATPSMSARIVSAAHWHINADEPSVIDYNTEFKPQDLYTATPYRASDHDPLLMGVDLQGPQAQTISFAALADQVLGASPLGLSASASSGLVVTFTSTTPAVCSVSASQVSLLAAGTCTIAADQAGNAGFLPAAQVLRSFVVRQPQTLSFGALPQRPLSAGSFTLAATASSGLPVSYASTAPTVCSVSGNTVSLLAAGNCGITASQAGDGLWAAATSVTQTFAVVSAVAGDEGDVPLPMWSLWLLGAGLLGAGRRRIGRSA